VGEEVVGEVDGLSAGDKEQNTTRSETHYRMHCGHTCVHGLKHKTPHGFRL
jgi:hypothetical protein